MLKHLMLAGALLLGGVALAGTAAATCANTPLGLFPTDNLSVCALESSSFSFPPYYSYDQTTFADVNYFGYNPSNWESTNAGLGASQYSGEQCWSCGSPDTYGGTSAYLYFSRFVGGQSDYGGVNVNQYNYNSPDWQYGYESTSISAYQQSGNSYKYVYAEQFTNNGVCSEYVYLYDGNAGGYLVQPQPCTVPIPQAPSL